MTDLRTYEHLTLTQLGKVFGVSSQKAGKWLVDIGLRTQDKKPSYKAFQGDYCVTSPTGRGGGYFYVWHRQKTVAALEAAGHRQALEMTTPSGELVGPFTMRQSGRNGFEIVDGDGSVGIWVWGHENAERLIRLLDVAYQHGVFA